MGLRRGCGGRRLGGGWATRKDSPPSPRSAMLRVSLHSHDMSWCQVDPKATKAEKILPTIGAVQDFPFDAACGDRVALGIDAAKEGNGQVENVCHVCVSELVLTTQGSETNANLHRSPCPDE